MALIGSDKFTDKYMPAIKGAKLLVVGAGGIGCELIKNLVLIGFEDIHIIDLDTIDVSNLNRQFLFHKQHIGKSKAIVAKESALKLRPNANITAIHDSISNPSYGIEFFKQFSAVLNALDNRAARSHVNRMCLAVNIPLIESGTEGYLGQVTVHKKGFSECYECQPRKSQKTFPGCTIRNTPSEPIHCIVWAKHLFNQLFGEEDADEDVSPDMADSEAGDDPYHANESGNIERKSTREWAKTHNYDPLKLFNKLFRGDILYLLRMDKLWKDRPSPSPLDWDNLPHAVAGSSNQVKPSMKDQEIWSIKHCATVFAESLGVLKKRYEDLNEKDTLVWDKDDKYCMDFVTACSNIRAHCFGIPLKSPFDVKSLAGNIIPAIATTNAVIAGLIVLQLLKVLKEENQALRTVVLNKHSATRKTLINASWPVPPNPTCYACSETSMVTVRLNANTMSVKTLEQKILKDWLNMIAPDVEIDNGKGTILISSDPEEMESEIYSKPLSDFGVTLTPRLKCDDFFQRFKFTLEIVHEEAMPEDTEFQIVGDISDLQPKKNVDEAENKDSEFAVDDDIAIEEIEEDLNGSKKRRLSDHEDSSPSSSKKRSRGNTVSTDVE